MFALFEILPLPLPYGLHPPMLIMAVYYGSVYKPNTMPFWLLFIIGIVVDALSGLPIGATSAALLVVRWICGRYSHLLANQSFIALWAGFVAIIFIFAAIIFGISAIVFGISSPIQLIASCALSGAVFPAIAILLHHIYSKV